MTKQERAQAVVDAFSVSPAIVVQTSSGAELLILSPEMSNPEEGKLRVSYMLPDGPRGHSTRKTVEELAMLVAVDGFTSLAPVDEDVVIAWTSTPEFIHGAKLSALVQADNELRYLASKINPETYREAVALTHQASDLAETDIDAAVKLLQDAIRELE